MRPRLGNQRGIATAMALIILMLLTGLSMAFLRVSALEPQISRNHADLVRARYAAEAGIEAAFNQMASSLNWTTFIAAAASCATGGGEVLAGLPALPSGAGYTVRVRNDCAAGDNVLTGLAVEGSPTVDNNGVVILESTGTANGASRTIQVVMRRIQLPPFPGAVNVPGAQADVFVNNTSFDIDGRDWRCTGGGSTCDNHANWTSDGPNPLKWGLATQTGTQANLSPPRSYETRAEEGFNTDDKQKRVRGKSEIDGTDVKGVTTIQEDAALNPTVMHAFLNLVANHPSTRILKSTVSCPMVLSGTATPDQPTLTNGCGLNQTLNLGSRSDPKLIYFRGELDTSSAFTGLRMNSGTLKGAGLLVIEDGDLGQYATLDWDGVVLVTGRYVGAGFRSGSNTNVFGTVAVMEDVAAEANGYFEFFLDPASAKFRASKQNLDMVQLMRPLIWLYGWREI